MIVRATRAAADSPVSGDWTPDNLNADESALDADDVILLSADWEDVRLVAIFVGSTDASETVDVLPLRAIPDAVGSLGRRWIPLDSVTLAPDLGNELVLVDGGLIAFRITAITLGTATSVNLVVTGGAERRGR